MPHRPRRVLNGLLTQFPLNLAANLLVGICRVDYFDLMGSGQFLQIL